MIRLSTFVADVRAAITAWTNPIFSGNATFQGVINSFTAANSGIEVGSPATVNTPFFDFHSSGNPNDYDARLIASGGTAANGQGGLTVQAGQLTVAAPTTVTDPSTTSTSQFTLNGAASSNGINLKLTGNGATTPSKWIRVQAGTFQIINNAYSVAILQLDDAGNLATAGGVTASGAALGFTALRLNAPGGASPLSITNLNTGSNTTKSVGIDFFGYDTVGTAKRVSTIAVVPADANWIASTLSFSARAGDLVFESFRAGTVVNAVNFINLLPNATGGAAQVTAQGSDANISIAISPKGTGNVTTYGPFVVSDPAPASITNMVLSAPANGNGANFKMLGNGSTTPSKTLRVLSGVLQIINDAYNAAIFTLDDVGNAQLSGLTVNKNELVAAADLAGAATWGQIRVQYLAGRSAMIRVDGANVYLLDSATPSGVFTAHRPFQWNLTTGDVILAGAGETTACGGLLTAPDFNLAGSGLMAGAWTKVVTSVSSSAGTLTDASCTVRYKKFGRTVFINMIIIVANNGTGSGSLVGVLPFIPADTIILSGREVLITGKALTGTAGNTSTSLSIQNYDNSYPGVNGSAMVITGVYEAKV